MLFFFPRLSQKFGGFVSKIWGFCLNKIRTSLSRQGAVFLGITNAKKRHFSCLCIYVSATPSSLTICRNQFLSLISHALKTCLSSKLRISSVSVPFFLWFFLSLVVEKIKIRRCSLTLTRGKIPLKPPFAWLEEKIGCVVVGYNFKRLTALNLKISQTSPEKNQILVQASKNLTLPKNGSKIAFKTQIRRLLTFSSQKSPSLRSRRCAREAVFCWCLQFCKSLYSVFCSPP